MRCAGGLLSLKTEPFAGRKMKRFRSAVYRERFDRLWDALGLCEARSAGEVSPEIVSGIIGCSVDYAGRLLFRRVRFIVSRNRRVYENCKN